MERLRRLVFDHRRLLAAACAGLAVLAGLSSVRADAPERRAVVTAARDLPSGTALTERDLQVRRVPPDVVPGRAFDAVEAVIGRNLAGPVRRGETLTDARLLGPGVLLGRPAGTVVATVRVADPVEVEAVAPGEVVDVVAVTGDHQASSREATVVAEGLEVVAVDIRTEEPGGAAVVRVATDRAAALALAEAAADGRLGVVTAHAADLE